MNDWSEEIRALRSIALQCGLKEERKWNQACFTHQGKNIFIVGGLKQSCVMSFFKGSLLKDKAGVLQTTRASSNISKFVFTSLKEIEERDELIRAYIFEAIDIEEKGLKGKTTMLEDLEIPMELEQKFKDDLAFKKAFKRLTPGRQKAYILFISHAKKSATREKRINKFYHRILEGKGMNDCVCGLSQYMPNCDGSHKNSR